MLLRTMLLVLVVVLVACGEEQAGVIEGAQRPGGDTSEVIVDHTQPLRKLVSESWIERQDRISPARWLASKLAGELLAQDDPRVMRMDEMITAVASHFVEGERMIANRTWQLFNMLKEKGVRDDVRDFLAGMERLGSRGAVGNFSQYVAYYANVRGDVESMDAAFARLDSIAAAGASYSIPSSQE